MFKEKHLSSYKPQRLLFDNLNTPRDTVESQKAPDNIDEGLSDQVKDLSIEELESKLKDAEKQLSEAQEKAESYKKALNEKLEPNDISSELPENFRKHLNLFDKPTLEQYENFSKMFKDPPKYSEVGKTIIDTHGRIIYMQFPGDNPRFEEIQGEQKVQYIDSRYQKSKEEFTVDSILLIHDTTETFKYAVIHTETPRPQDQIMMVSTVEK